MKILAWLGIALGAFVVALGIVAFAARFTGGPIGPFPGATLSGSVASEPAGRWEPLLEGVGRIQLQVGGQRPRSVTTGYVLHDGKLYIPSPGAERKTWPKLVLEDDRVVLRIRGELYERRARRVTERAELRALVRDGDGARGEDGEVDLSKLTTWFFRIEPR